jgi:hypothetical protein
MRAMYPAVAAALTLAACDVSSGVEEKSAALNTTMFTIKAQEGSGQEITLACGPNSAPGLQLDLDHVPESPPPLDGVYGTFAFPTGKPMQVELAWATGSIWMPRRDVDGTRIVERFLEGGGLRFQPPMEYSKGGEIAWQAAALGEALPRAQKECAR